MSLTRFLRRTQGTRGQIRAARGFGVPSLTGRGRQEFVPSIGKGLLLNMPLRRDTRMIYSAGGADGFSTETVDADGTYVARTALGGLVTDATANTARIEDDGLLCEGTRTNLITYSRDFSNAAWAKTNVTVGTGSIVCPDGTTRTTNTLTATASNGTVIQDLGAIASAANSGALWIKRKTGTGSVYLTLDGGSTYTEVTVTSVWTRVKKENQTLADPDFGIKIATDADAVYVDYGQVEAAATVSSTIPTTTASVERAADVFLVDNTSAVHLKAATGSIFLALHANGLAITSRPFDAYFGLSGVFFFMDSSRKPNFRCYDGVGIAATLVASDAWVAGSRHILTGVYAENDFRMYVDGGDEKSDTSGAAPSAIPTSLGVGSRANGTLQTFMEQALLLTYSDAKSAADVATIATEMAEWMT